MGRLHKNMVATGLCSLLAALSPSAEAQTARTDTLFVVCATVMTGSELIKTSPVAEVTVPWLPEGTTEPNTIFRISATYLNYAAGLENGEIRHAFCATGATPAKARVSLDNDPEYGIGGLRRSGVKVSEAAFDAFWPAFLDYLCMMDHVGADPVRSQYVARPAG